jgi:hypothetical protein
MRLDISPLELVGGFLQVPKATVSSPIVISDDSQSSRRSGRGKQDAQASIPAVKVVFIECFKLILF